MIFKESALTFEFSGNWNIKKYDSHKYYKILAGQGLKGIDFLGIKDGQQLYLFEVKNYQKRKDWQTVNPIEAIKADPDVLVRKLVQKIEDSFQVFRVVYKYYQRNWWYRNIFPLIRNWWPVYSKWHFWTDVYEKSLTISDIYIIFWMETAPEEQELKAYLRQELRLRLNQFSPHIYLLDHQNNSLAEILSVKT